MDNTKPNQIKKYLILSIFIHLFIIFFTNKKNDEFLGNKIIPIEVFDNFLETGKGEATKREKAVTRIPSIKEEANRNQKQLEQPNSSEKNNQINYQTNNNEVKRSNNKKNIINQTVSKEIKGSGSKEGVKTNEPEKGSIKGNREIKITCLKCIRPIYPPIALRRGAEGKPIIKTWININGKVTKAEFINKSGIKSIDDAAMKAAINSTFYPLNKDTIINIEYELKIK